MIKTPSPEGVFILGEFPLSEFAESSFDLNFAVSQALRRDDDSGMGTKLRRREGKPAAACGVIRRFNNAGGCGPGT